MTSLQAIRKQVLILLGPPGAGKGSQAALIKEHLQVAHISTGDLLRDNIAKGTSLGKQAKSFMDQGQLVPDDLIFDMLFARVEGKDCEKGYILDGFPRTIKQAEALEKKLEADTVVAINLEVPDSIVIDRITKRQICKNCQTPYHLLYSPPKCTETCDHCGGTLYQRSDDTHEVVAKRLQVYHDQTAPLIDYYSRKKTLFSIESSRSKEAVLLEILKILSKN